MGRLLIITVFAGLIAATVTSGTEIRRYMDDQFYNLALLTKVRL